MYLHHVTALAPWGSKNRTRIVQLADGRRVAVQEYSDPATARVRLHAAQQLAAPLNEHGVPVPRVLVQDLAAPSRWAAFDALPGEPAYVAAGDDLWAESFPALARGMGLLVRRMGELDPAAFDLPRLWTDAEALSSAAERWLADLTEHLPAADALTTRDIIRGLPALFTDRQAVVCHGDLRPPERTGDR